MEHAISPLFAMGLYIIQTLGLTAMLDSKKYQTMFLIISTVIYATQYIVFYPFGAVSMFIVFAAWFIVLYKDLKLTDRRLYE